MRYYILDDRQARYEVPSYASLEEAESAARERADSEPGVSFHVMQPVGRFYVPVQPKAVDDGK